MNMLSSKQELRNQVQGKCTMDLFDLLELLEKHGEGLYDLTLVSAIREELDFREELYKAQDRYERGVVWG